MNRKTFIKNCGTACLGLSSISFLLQSCSGGKIISAKILDNNLVIDLHEFEIKKKDNIFYRKYIIVQNEKLRFPICIYRFSENDFSALYMQCTHQGNELNAYGERLVCSAHGSEFDKRGIVTRGPSEKSLKTFPVQIHNSSLLIPLKAA